MEAVEKHFHSTNEKDQNRAHLRNLKQKGHPMDMFLLKFKNYTLLADYNDMQLIVLLEINADKDIISHVILENKRYTSLQKFKADLCQVGSCKQLLEFIQKGTAKKVWQKDPNVMDIDAVKTGKNIKYFNYSKEGHFSKDCGQTRI